MLRRRQLNRRTISVGIGVGAGVGVGVDTRRLLPHHRLERRDGEFVRHRERVVAEHAAAVAPRTTVWWQRIESHEAYHRQLRSLKVAKHLWQTAKRVGVARLELRVNCGLPYGLLLASRRSKLQCGFCE